MEKVEKFTLKLKGVKCIILEEISMMPPKFLTLLDVYLQVSLCNNQTFGGIYRCLLLETLFNYNLFRNHLLIISKVMYFKMDTSQLV